MKLKSAFITVKLLKYCFVYFSIVYSLGFFVSGAAFGAEKISLWEHEKDEDQALLDELIARFNKENPGIEVKRSHYKTEDLRTQFQTAAIGGGGGDIVLAPNDFAGPFALMGIIKPVQSWAKPERFLDSVVASVQDAQKNIWGLPVTAGNHLMLFVNKKLVPTVPQSLEELVNSAKKISDPAKKVYGFAYHLNEPFWLVPFVGGFGEAVLVDGKPKLDTAAMVSSLETVSGFKFKDKIVPPDCDYTCADTLFVEGKVGIIINGDWAVQRYANALKEQLDIGPLPKVKASGVSMKPFVSGKYLFYNKNLKSKKLEAAHKFGEFLASKTIQEYMITKGQRIPVLKELEKSTLIRDNKNLAKAMAAMEYGVPMPMNVEMRVVWDSMRPQLQAVMAGRSEPKVASQAMQKDADTKIKELKQ